ncbi:T7SS effector LXG polymorphic toxin [Metabacillus litoralis]|uniref:T7SS effector LXG polymorphic toxin n=1 Tax=Metabacillus litoralis TaxID=152268 RepID=UPI00203D4A9E|nr:T7SS effector LXG polymorphic toxin [Metabacillus litoralis]MCM3410491.1 T7SS effector LXG polymorphic toxin [Metabacillus litoralis]
MRVLDSQSLVNTMEKRSNDYEKLRSQLESLQKTFQALVELDSFTGKGADAIKGFYKAHTEVIDAWFQLIDCQIAFFNGVNHKLISDKLGAETVVHNSFLEDDVSKSERHAEDMVDQHRSELNSIFQKINDILSLQVFSTSDFQAYMDDSRVKRQKTIEAVERVDQELLNEYMYSMYEQDNAQSLYQALKDATSTGVKIQPINFNAKAFRTSEIYQLQAGAKFHTDNYLRLKNKELEEQGIQTNTLFAGNLKNAEFNVAEFSGYNDLLRAIYGFDPVTGSQLSKNERLNYTMLLYMRYGLLKVSPEKVEKKENEELNFFDKSLNSFKEIGQDVWYGLETRADKMFDSPYDFANYLTLGGLDGVKVTWEGAKLRYNNSTDSFYDFLNYLTFGSADIINGTFNPEDLLSKEHWLNSLSVITLGVGGASSILLRNRPNINGSIEGKRKGNEDGVEGADNLKFKNAGEYFDYINQIGKRSDLSIEQKLSKILAGYNALEVKGDVTVISDAKFLKPEGFGANGRMIVDWPKDMGFNKDFIQSISNNNPLPIKWDRIGGKTGENFTTLPENGVPYTYDQRAIPYLENPSARHVGTFDNDSYFDAIDAIKDENLDVLNKIVAANGKNPISSVDFDDFMAHYKDFKNNAKNVVGNVDATYGLKGTAAPWYNSSTGELLMNGGAEQIVTPLNAEMLEKIGIITKY